MKCSTRYQLRLTPAQKEKLLARASLNSVSAADVMRELIENGKNQPVLSINLAQWGKLTPLMSNLNQLVRLANKGKIDPDIVTTLEAIKTEVLAIRHDLVMKEAARQ